jgi:hypothetical protein
MVGILKSNFQEIYHAVHSSTHNNLDLVANLTATHIYDASRGWGRLWKWFYRSTEWLLGKNLRFDRLKQAISKTHSLFQQQLPLIRKHLDAYETYMKKNSGGYAVNERHVFSARQAITQWNDSTLTFIKVVQKHPIKLHAFFKRCFGKKLPEKKILALFSCPSADLSRLRGFQKLIDLEGFSNGPLPLAIFEKVARGKILKEGDRQELNYWIKKINRSSCQIRLLHQALQAFIAEIENHNANSREEKADLTRLQMTLEENGCLLFQQEDPIHIRWRKRLKEGSILELHEKKIILGEPIGKKKIGTDNTLIFSIKELPHLVALIGQNQAILSIKQRRHNRENGYGIEPVPFLEVIDNGRWALVEKLKPLSSHVWTSTKESLSAEDKKLVSSLVTLLKWLIKQNHTPKNFSAHFLMWDCQNQLKSLRPTSKAEFDFNAMEDFSFQCAAGNLKIFQYLMGNSGLSSHPTAKFYQEIIAQALKGDSTRADDLAGIYQIDDPKVVDRSAKLSQQIVELRNACCLKIQEAQPAMELNEMEKLVNKNILLCHKRSKAAGILWPSLLQEVLASVQKL